MKELVLVSCSGGMDSSTTLSILKLAEYENIRAVHFKYGHRGEECEERAITNVCNAMDVPLTIFDISDNYKAMGVEEISMLANKNAKIITGTEAGLKTTAAWHPARNLLFMNYMIALAESEIMRNHYDVVYLAGGFMQLSESGCFVPTDEHTITTADNMQVHPLSVKVGDKILSFNFDKKEFEPSEVKHVYKSEHDTTYKISLTFDEGPVHSKKVLLLSKEHPVYIKNKGWVETKDLQVGDMCYTYRECGTSMRTSHMTSERRKCLAEAASARFKGISLKPEHSAKISNALKGKPKTEEHCKRLSESLMGKLVGDKNPMYGHIRSNTVECWCGQIHKCPDSEKESIAMKKKWQDPEFRKTVIDNCAKFWNDPEKSKIARQTKSEIQKKFVVDYINKHGGHWNSTPEARKKLSIATSKAIKEGKINPATLFNKGPNKAEKKLIELFENLDVKLRYVGDGQIWITSRGTHMNPDFINIDQRKVVEYYGGIGFFHSLEEIEERDKKYKDIGWDHLAIIETEMNDMESVKNKVLNFMMDVHNGWIIENIEKIDGKQEMWNFHCEPNNNFFLNKVLTHNTYPDNTSYFVDACLNAAKYGTLIGNRLKPLYCCCNLMKSEQYALIDHFHLYHIYKNTISCDRPKLIERGGVLTPCNCSKNGMPACGSGLLSYWAGKMVGVDDMHERNFYEVEDEEYTAYRPPHLNLQQRQFDIEKIIDRIKLPKNRLDILKSKL